MDALRLHLTTHSLMDLHDSCQNINPLIYIKNILSLRVKKEVDRPTSVRIRYFFSEAKQEYASENETYDDYAESGKGLFENECRDEHGEQDAGFAQDCNRGDALLTECPDNDRVTSC